MSREVAADPADYADWLADIKARVVTARQRAALVANAELIQLYSQVGRDIGDVTWTTSPGTRLPGLFEAGDCSKAELLGLPSSTTWAVHRQERWLFRGRRVDQHRPDHGREEPVAATCRLRQESSCCGARLRTSVGAEPCPVPEPHHPSASSCPTSRCR